MQVCNHLPDMTVDRSPGLLFSEADRQDGGPVLDNETIQTTSLADEIAFRVESAIIEGIYPPGSRLRQDELCNRFRVSRTPVREALRKLQARNLVVVVPNKGATVRVPTRKELMEVYEVRSELEGYACELAASHVTGDIVAKLEEAQHRIESLLQELEHHLTGDADAARLYVQVNLANDEFHDLIHVACGNDRLRQLIHELGRLFPKDYVWRAVRSSDEMRRLNVDDHLRIRGALMAGDGDAARRAMREHIIRARTVLLIYLDGYGFWT
jgi:DNA-binding GntR family transcriptional regulator